MHGVFTNVLWYLEFFAFAVVLIAFFGLFLYLASINYVRYGPKNDFKKNTPSPTTHYNYHIKKPAEAPAILPAKMPVDSRPVCCDTGCVWFFGVMGSIVTIALCYYFAYALLSDTKLRFGIFVP